MKLIKLTCPSCGAQFNVDPESKIGFCQFCGNSLYVDEADERKEYVYRKIDEAEIKKVESQTDIRKVELEHDFKRKNILLGLLGIYVLVLLIVMIIAIVGMINNSESSKFIWFVFGVMVSLPVMIYLTTLLARKEAMASSKNPIKNIVILWISYLIMGFIVFLLISGYDTALYLFILYGIIAFELYILYKK